MTQPIDIISSALRSIGALASGEVPGAAKANAAFDMLNDFLDQLSNDDFAIISINEIVGTIAGRTDWTIGPGGDINAQRPLTINSAFVRINATGGALDYPVQVLNIEQYELIGMKQLPGPWPRALWYNSGTPLGTIKFWPLPSQGEIHLICDQLFTRFATINDAVLFPQGYNMMLRWNLAYLLMPEYGKTNQSQIAMIKENADRSLGAVKSSNMKPAQTAQFDPMLTANRWKNDAGWILTGGFV